MITFIMLEQEPWGDSGMGYQSTARFKLLSVGDGKYLYNGEIYGRTTWGSIFATHSKIAKQVNAIIDERLLGKTPEVESP